MKISNLFSTLKISAAGLNTFKTQLAVTAENIANASTTRTDAGTPYKRKTLLKKASQDQAMFSRVLNHSQSRLRTSRAGHIGASVYGGDGQTVGEAAKIEMDVKEDDQFRKVYEPDHPDADSDGFVDYPKINVVMEMLDLITASRSYEANLTVMNSAKSLARKSMDI